MKGEAPGGVSGLAPQRVATHTDRPSLSIATALSAPQLIVNGRLPQGAIVLYGSGRSLIGGGSSAARCAEALANTAGVSASAARGRGGMGAPPGLLGMACH